MLLCAGADSRYRSLEAAEAAFAAERSEALRRGFSR